MNRLLMVLALGMFLGFPAISHADEAPPQQPEREAEEGEEEADELPKVDRRKPYRRVGNTWLTRTTTKIDGQDEATVSYARTTVVSIEEEQANIRYESMDAEQEVVNTIETQVSLAAAPEDNPDGLARPEVTRTKVTVPAGEFDALRHKVERGGTTSNTYICVETGLVAKVVSKSNVAETTVELISHEVE
jgi:hypothetical protein